MDEQRKHHAVDFDQSGGNTSVQLEVQGQTGGVEDAVTSHAAARVTLTVVLIEEGGKRAFHLPIDRTANSHLKVRQVLQSDRGNWWREGKIRKSLSVSQWPSSIPA